MTHLPNKKATLILGVLVLLLLILGLGAGYFVSQQSQDLRQQAYVNCASYNNNFNGCVAAGCNWDAASVKDCMTTFTTQSACDSVKTEGCAWQNVPFCKNTASSGGGQPTTCNVDLETCMKKPPAGCEYVPGYCYGVYSSSSGICSGPVNVCINSPLGQVNLGCGADECSDNAKKVCSCDGNAEVISCSCVEDTAACGGGGGGTDPGTDPGSGGGSGGGGGSSPAPTTKSFNGTVVAEDTGTSRYISPAVSLTCLNGNCSNISWASDSSGGHFDAKAGNIVSLNLTPKAGYSSCNYSVVERDCSTLQTVKTYASGNGCTATFEKSGTDCDWKYGVNFTMLKNPTPVSASYNAVCTPGQAYSADGSKLSYDFTFTNVQPQVGFQRAIVFLSIGGGELTTAQEQSFEAAFGKPTWASNGANPTCVNQDWCGYWWLSSYTYSPTIFLQGQKYVPGTSTLRLYGGGTGKGTIQDLVSWGQANGKTNWNFGATVSTLDGQSTSGLNKVLSIKPDACAPAPVTKTWTIVPNLVCANPAVPPASFAKRLVWTIWPPTPVTWNYNPALSATGSMTNPTQVISVGGVVPSSVENVYVAMVKASDGDTWGTKSFLPLTGPTGSEKGKYFTSQSDMFKWGVNSVPNGTVNLTFQAPAEYCVVPSPIPTPSPSPLTSPKVSPIASPTPSPSPTLPPAITPTPTATASPTVTPTPAIGPMCLGICASVNNSVTCSTTPQVTVGSQLRFTCTEVPGVTQYAFRVIYPNGQIRNLTATGRVSSPIRVTEKGQYLGQCRVCPNGICAPFTTPTDMSIMPIVSPSPAATGPITPRTRN